MGSLWDVLRPGYGNKIYRLAGIFRASRLRSNYFGRNTAWGSAWIRKEIRFGDRDCRRGRVAILYPQLDYPRLSDLPSSARLRPVLHSQVSFPWGNGTISRIYPAEGRGDEAWSVCLPQTALQFDVSHSKFYWGRGDRTLSTRVGSLWNCCIAPKQLRSTLDPACVSFAFSVVSDGTRIPLPHTCLRDRS